GADPSGAVVSSEGEAFSSLQILALSFRASGASHVCIFRWLSGIGLLCLCLTACTGRPSAESAGDVSPNTQETLTVPGMDSEQQAFLWDIEHHGNILSRVGFGSLTKALREGDENSLAALLSPRFEGGLLHQPKQVAIHNEFLDVARQSDGGKSALPADAKQFLAKLLEYRAYFQHAIQGSKLALMTLRPSDETNLDAPWEGSGQLRLWGERQPGRPAEAIIYISYKTVRPTKEAMAKGNWLLGCTITQSQLGSSRHFLMRECATARGFKPDRMQDNWKCDRQDPATGGVFLCDFDRDGYLDALITDVRGYFLYKGKSDGTFSDVTEDFGLPVIPPESNNRSLVAAWIDIDGDGWEDLILGKYLFRNEQGKRFRDVTAQCNLRLPVNITGVSVADYDGDGRLDLYAFQPGKGRASSWLDGKSGSTAGGGNLLFRNKGDWQFEDVTAQSGTDGGDRSTFTALWLDANDDGKPDLYVPNEVGDGVLYVNQGNGTFRPTSLSNSPCDFGTMGATCGDVNNDGRIDIYCGNMYSEAGSRVIGNVREGTYPPAVMENMRTFVRGSQLHLNRGDGRW